MELKFKSFSKKQSVFQNFSTFSGVSGTETLIAECMQQKIN